MTELVLAAADAELLRSSLLDGDSERCAILFTNEVDGRRGTKRLLVSDIVLPLADDYSKRTRISAELKPDFVARVTKRARTNSAGLVFVHSHPGDSQPAFSKTDDGGERHLADFLARRHPSVLHASLVISAGGLRARHLGTTQDIRVSELGTTRNVLFETESSSSSDSIRFDRQIRAFGKHAQDVLRSLRIAIVGLGGTGSIVAEELVHLGVRNFLLIDADVVEVTNLNRIAAASAADLNRAKVDVAARYIRDHDSTADVDCIRGDVMQGGVAQELLSADLIFLCTDSHGSRAVVQQVAYQYMIPCIDMGVVIAVNAGLITHIYGRVQLLSPGLACLTCSDLLDPAEVRRDMMTNLERKADPYIQGEREPAPAVMSLNGTVASLAVTMMLAVFATVPSKGRHLLYNAIASTLRQVRAEPATNCFICSHYGALARGDSWPLFARKN